MISYRQKLENSKDKELYYKEFFEVVYAGLLRSFHQRKAQKGKSAWNKGLTKETSEIVKKYADKKRGIPSGKKGIPSGRKGIACSEIAKKKMRATKAANPNPLYIHSEETKKKLSALKKGKIGTWVGRKHSKETKKKISGSKLTEEAKKKQNVANIILKGRRAEGHLKVELNKIGLTKEDIDANHKSNSFAPSWEEMVANKKVKIFTGRIIKILDKKSKLTPEDKQVMFKSIMEIEPPK